MQRSYGKCYGAIGKLYLPRNEEDVRRRIILRIIHRLRLARLPSPMNKLSPHLHRSGFSLFPYPIATNPYMS